MYPLGAQTRLTDLHPICHKGGQLERRGGLPFPFLKINKKCPEFRKKGPDCVHPYVKFTIQNIVLRVFKR